jgi:hypothetical protein
MREITGVDVRWVPVLGSKEVTTYNVYYTCQLTSKKPRNLRLSVHAVDEMAAYAEAVRRFNKYDRARTIGRLKNKENTNA